MQLHKANNRNASVRCNMSFTRSYNFCNGIEFVIVKVHGSIGEEGGGGGGALRCMLMFQIMSQLECLLFKVQFDQYPQNALYFILTLPV